ncbi:hypothetical protein DsansV1_C26g0190971 [Dioscorea sansibarensis]
MQLKERKGPPPDHRGRCPSEQPAATANEQSPNSSPSPSQIYTSISDPYSQTRPDPLTLAGSRWELYRIYIVQQPPAGLIRLDWPSTLEFNPLENLMILLLITPFKYIEIIMLNKLKDDFFFHKCRDYFIIL